MHKEQFKLQALSDLSTADSTHRFVAALNQILETMSNRLPSPSPQLTKDTKTIANVTSRKPVTIPAVVANPVDVTALKNDLEQQSLAKIKDELAQLKRDIDTISTTLTHVLEVLVVD